ncbi:hypothetical protein [Cohnella terricola]|uniref:Uncharacterized protein n=1 Tax=Cohnella terricola TaxID=1289167 RepID=A0A559JSZ2_9BACL|nr:hypothetical protein [Cohnella terricola]TVY02991.1 hypothetical protein FPZ45_03630 [Cohnella terricola]
MSDNHENSADTGTGEDQPKKLSQADAIKRILEKKKQARQGAGKGGYSTDTKKMKTQIHKVQNNQKRRTGV